jgi:hypothetical protein
MPPDEYFEKLHKALIVSEGDAWDGAVSILNDIIPDNSGFTLYDATEWERRLAIIGNSTMPFADRKAAILQKMAYPGIDAAPRQAASFLQTQLRAAGYDVYVYENIFPDGMGGFITKTPSEILGIPAGTAIYGTFEYGEVEYGEEWIDAGITLCVNYLEESKDAVFAIGSNYRSTFYIAGNPITTFADVDATRKENFRQLILQLKPAQTVGILFVNYI